MHPELDRDPALLSDLLSALGYGLCTIDADGRIAGWDDAATRALGFRRAEVLGRPAAALDGPAPCIAPALLELQRGSAVAAFTGALRARGERVIAVTGAVRRVLGTDGSVCGALLALRARDREVASPRVATPSIPGIVGDSEAMREVLRRVRLAAASDVTVSVVGESGTGKELVARAVHELGGRRERPFVALHCAALPEALLESELFGHEKGAFTGADRERQGLIESADGGTLFLDEVGELGSAMQVKLLRVLQEREVRRLGAERARPVDLRLVTATNRDLRELLQSGAMREDFYYRIHVYEIAVPPLRERRSDVPLLVDWFVQRLARSTGRPVHEVSDAALRRLVAHAWPGNVRELKNAIEHAFVGAEGGCIEPRDLPVGLRVGAVDPVVQRGTSPGASPGAVPGSLATAGGWSPRELDEREQVLAELRRHDWNRNATALALGYSRVTLWKKMRKYGIDEGVFRRGG